MVVILHAGNGDASYSGNLARRQIRWNANRIRRHSAPSGRSCLINCSSALQQAIQFAALPYIQAIRCEMLPWLGVWRPSQFLQVTGLSSTIYGVRQQIITCLVQQTLELKVGNWCPLHALNAHFCVASATLATFFFSDLSFLEAMGLLSLVSSVSSAKGITSM